MRLLSPNILLKHMLKIDQQELTGNQDTSIRSIYDRYGSMLLGYINNVVKDNQEAEGYFVRIFSDAAQHFRDINWKGDLSWLQLNNFAKNRLSFFLGAVNHSTSNLESGTITNTIVSRKFEGLTETQKKVFCAVYFYGKTVAVIAVELDEKEVLIRKALKEAFAIIRKNSEH